MRRYITVKQFCSDIHPEFEVARFVSRALMAREYAVEEIQHQDDSNPKDNLERDVLFLDDFFVEAAASWGVKVFGFVIQVVCS